MSDTGTLLSQLSPGEIAASREYISTFFRGREFWQGGEVPGRLLVSEVAVRLAAEAGCNLGPQLFHEMLDAHEAAGLEVAGLKPGDTLARGRFYLDLAAECRRLNIPQEYSGGLIVLWLWLCRGVRLAGEGGDRRPDAAA